MVERTTHVDDSNNKIVTRQDLLRYFIGLTYIIRLFTGTSGDDFFFSISVGLWTSDIYNGINPFFPQTSMLI